MRRRWPAARYLAALAGPLMLAGIFTGLGPADAAIMTCRTWTGTQPVSVGTDGSLSSVAVPSATQAWAVGWATDNQGNRHALIEHWNGSTWAVVPAPRLRTSSLASVRSAAPASIWAVGSVLNARQQERTLILHWNGTAWAQQPSPSPGRLFSRLDGVRVVSATNAWAVGEFSNSLGTEQPLILHWNGTAWNRLTSASPAPFTNLAAIAATSAANAWAVGLTGSPEDGPLQPSPATTRAVRADPGTFILRWNGKAWIRQSSPSPGVSDQLAGVGATSATNAWAVGRTGPEGLEQTLILRWNGRTWRWVTSPDPGGSATNNDLFGVTATSAGNAWAVGSSDQKATILQWDGHTWQEVLGVLSGSSQLSGVAASSAGNAWAVGDISDGTATQPLAFHCTS